MDNKQETTNTDEKKKMDPGWNDPPILNYSKENPPPKSRITNKRIAFPLNPTESTTLSQSTIRGSSLKTPPPPSSHVKEN